MDMDSMIAIFLCLIVPGLFAIVHSILLLKGKGIKWLYMTDDIYTGRAYIGLPLGIACLFFAMSTIPQDLNTGLTIGYIGGGIGLLGLIFAFIQPSFLKPAWLKWLEQEYDDIMPLLREEVKQMGLNVWNSKMQNQEDIEKWADNVRHKRGL